MRPLATWTCLALFGTASAAAAQSQLVIVSGLGGDPRYTAHFGALATSLAQAAHEKSGLPDSAIAWFGEPSAPRSAWYRGPSTRTNVEKALQRIASADTASQVVIVLIGHGAGEGAETRISLPGADLTASDFSRILDSFGKRHLAFINMTSASGDMLSQLSAPGRVVMTATRSAFERNESQFAQYFVDAIASGGADTDKDNRVSLLEAFTYADTETKRFYEQEQRIATEHPQMADESGIARRFFLAAAEPGASSDDPRVRALVAERAGLERELEELRARKEKLTVAEYETQLERLLLGIARASQEIRRLGAEPGGEARP